MTRPADQFDPPPWSWRVWRGPMLVLALSASAVGACFAVEQAFPLAAGVAVLLCATAPGLLAAGEDRHWPALLRGADIIDGCGVGALLGWLVLGGESGVTLGAILSLYVVLLSVGGASLAAGRVGRRASTRLTAATAWGMLVLLLCASPFWISARLRPGRTMAAQQADATGAVFVNPYYAATNVFARQTGFVWHTEGVLYRLTRVGEYAPPRSVSWWTTAAGFAAAGALLASLALVSNRRKN